jgi:transposase-like protein
MSRPTDGQPRGSDGPASGGVGPERGRFTSRRKQEVVLRLLRGEPLETLSRELGVAAATLSGWRDQFLQAGTAALKSRPSTPQEEDLARLQAKSGELTMANELLAEKIARIEGDRPLARRRPRP